ncbi:DgyrCDS13844 [Dimorphilus gyrociliatus]|uniref:Regulation of nuclear pre-mRNA domain-containing protein 2 n=1 Tax=Dimorphilus gyrociliatus TaxID=2664684 RepID=A0A7I8WBW3_9ANNE|nr:DgyrCDS13844 [Dimorphilus gyrociliatus]
MSSKKLNEANVQKKLKEVENTIDSIQTLSLWIIHHKANHERIVDLWLKSLQEATLAHRVTLFNLCNDVVQNCKRKHAPMYQDSFKRVLTDAAEYVKDEAIRQKITRLVKIWADRKVYDKEFLVNLAGILDGRKVDTDASHVASVVDDFKPEKILKRANSLNPIKAKTENLDKALRNARVDASNIEAIKQLKDLNQGKEFYQNFEDSVVKLKTYVGYLKDEIVQRKSLIEVLEEGSNYYSTQENDAKIVAKAYKNFGKRMQNCSTLLDQKIKILPEPATDDREQVDMDLEDDQDLDLQLSPIAPESMKPLPNRVPPMVKNTAASFMGNSNMGQQIQTLELNQNDPRSRRREKNTGMEFLSNLFAHNEHGNKMPTSFMPEAWRNSGSQGDTRKPAHPSSVPSPYTSNRPLNPPTPNYYHNRASIPRTGIELDPIAADQQKFIERLKDSRQPSSFQRVEEELHSDGTPVHDENSGLALI